MQTAKQLVHDDYTVAWIAPLEVESIAARLMLDTKHEKLPQSSVDHNVYTLGSINGHNVVIASLPVTGNTSAATVVTQLRNTFKQIRFGLLVGIGGGVPTRTDNGPIHLGDVVVSKPERDHSGAIQYDHGKALEGQFRRTGYLVPPPTVLLNAAQDLSTEQAIAEDDLIMPHLKRINTKRPALRRFKYPGPDQDNLYKSDYPHQAEGSSCSSCACDPSKMIDRYADDDQDDEIQYDRSSQVVVHRGTIAAGERVIKDGRLRDELAIVHGALCFEIEAAGVMNDFPCLVIRGISDYADSHKNDGWHGYASASAAAYARQLFFHMPVDEVKQCSVGLAGVVEELRNVTGAIEQTAERQNEHNQRQQQHNQQQEIRYESDRQRQCHQAFKICGYEDQKNINPEPVPGTCQWVLTHDLYNKWYRNPHSDLLWVSADPGCGKSVLSRKLVDQDLRNSSAHTVCYFFFKDNDDQNNLPVALCSILHQLFARQPKLIQYALPAWDKHGETIRSEREELWRILLEAVSDPESHGVSCVFDALDECRDDHRARFISMLSEFYQTIHSKPGKQGCLKIIATSRPYDEIRDGFEKIPSSLPTIHLRGDEMNDCIHHEINLVVHAKIVDLARAQSLSENVKRKLENKLFEMEHRTYLWLYLAIEGIRRAYANSLRPEEVSIESLPTSVEDAYEMILEKITPEQIDVAKEILQIIVGARRPLTIGELAHALGVSIGLNDLRRKIRRLCGLFVFFNNSRIYLIHQTAKEFLVGSLITGNSAWKHCFHPTETERLMARICVNYLLSNDLGEYTIHYDLMDYAANHWISHVQDGAIFDLPLITSVGKLCDIGDGSASTWFRVYSKSTNRPAFWRRSRLERPKPGLYWAVALELICATKFFLETKGAATYNRDGLLSIFLIATSNKRFGAALMNVLLDHCGDEITITPKVVVAAVRNGKEVVDLLLNRRRDEIKITPEVVVAAASNRSKEVITLLLNRCRDEIKITPEVMIAAASNNKDIIELLLNRCRDEIYITPEVVVAAAKNYFNSKEVMKLLLNRCRDEIQITPEVVVAAASNNSKEVIALLLSQRRDEVKITQEVVVTAAKSSKEVIELLLNQYRDKIQITPEVVVAAAKNYFNSKDVMELLLNQRRDKIQITQEVVVAASMNSDKGKEVITLLLDQPRDEVKITQEAIVSIAQHFSKDIMALLFNWQRVHIEITQEIVVAAAGNSKEVMELLLNQGRDKIQITQEVVVAAAMNYKGKEVIELLLNQCGDRIQITPEVVVAAAMNYKGKEVIELLLNQCGDRIQITPEVVIAATNNYNGKDILILLFNRRGYEFRITEELVKAVARNWKSEKEIMEFLLKQGIERFDVSAGLVAEVARSFDKRAMALLLKQRGDEFKITEEVVKAAAENGNSGKKIMGFLLTQGIERFDVSAGLVAEVARSFDERAMALLLKQRGDKFKITEDVLIAAARNVNSGKEMIELLIERRGDEFKVTEEVVKAAAANEYCRRDLLPLLFDQSSDMIRAAIRKEGDTFEIFSPTFSRVKLDGQWIYCRSRRDVQSYS